MSNLLIRKLSKNEALFSYPLYKEMKPLYSSIADIAVQTDCIKDIQGEIV